MVVDAQGLFGMGFKLARPHRLAGFSTADLHSMAAYRMSFKVVVETDNTVNFGAGEIQASGNCRHCGLWNIAQLPLNGMQ
jgi:hypothetical protein